MEVLGELPAGPEVLGDVVGVAALFAIVVEGGFDGRGGIAPAYGVLGSGERSSAASLDLSLFIAT